MERPRRKKTRLFALLIATVLSLSFLVSAVNAQSVVATVTVGANPAGVAYDSGKGEIFVANEGGSTVSVITDTTNAVVATITVSYPIGVVYDSGKGEVFVTSAGSNMVSVISDSTNTVVATVPVGSGP